MTLRTRTVEYVLPSYTGTLGSGVTLAAAPLYEWPAITCSFPESGSSRVFKSVMAEFTWNDYWGAAVNLSGVQFGISSGSVSASYVNKIFAPPPLGAFTIVANSGDPEPFSYLVDFTNEVTNTKLGTTATSGVFQFSRKNSHFCDIFLYKYFRQTLFYL